MISDIGNKSFTTPVDIEFGHVDKIKKRYYPFIQFYDLGDNHIDANDNMIDICDWLKDNISAPLTCWAITNINADCLTAEYIFKTVEDAMAFKLRWE